MALSEYFNGIRREVDRTLEALAPPPGAYPTKIHESMRYSLFAGGKRLRPMLAVAACDAVGGGRAGVMPFAAALEMIHTYTLIHDDLPALDNDDMRRGMPTNHRKFGEATAILAGDALLTLAFQVMASNPTEPAGTALTVIAETADAVGSMGTIGGQVVDMENENGEPNIAMVEYIHTHKTGKLIAASVRGGARLGGCGDDQLDALTEYGRRVGLAFQIIDDILDIEGDEAKLGKNLRSDIKKGKLTYPAVTGMDQSRKLASELTDSALQSLDMFGSEADHLRDLAKYIIARTF